MNGLANGVFTGDRLLDIGNGPWIDWSEQAIITGWSSYTGKIIKYKIVGNTVFVIFYIAGTSNSTSTNFTLPIATTFLASTVGAGYGVDNGTSNVIISYIDVTINSQQLRFNRFSAATTFVNTWTASGTKSVQGEFFYQI